MEKIAEFERKAKEVKWTAKPDGYGNLVVSWDDGSELMFRTQEYEILNGTFTVVGEEQTLTFGTDSKKGFEIKRT